jgi:hypothetical protein
LRERDAGRISWALLRTAAVLGPKGRERLMDPNCDPLLYAKPALFVR